MKKIISLITAIFIAFGMVGCGSNPNKDIENTVVSYLTSIQEGDLKSAESNCIPDYKDALFLNMLNPGLENARDQLHLDESFVEENQEYVKNVLMQVVKEYEIKDINVQDDEATVEVALSSIDVYDVASMYNWYLDVMEAVLNNNPDKNTNTFKPVELDMIFTVIKKDDGWKISETEIL